jgi:hypothetical protein
MIANISADNHEVVSSVTEERKEVPRAELHIAVTGQNKPISERVCLKLTNAEREWLSGQRARPCKHGHPRYDARVYRTRSGSLWLDCTECVRKRVNAYRRRINTLTVQAR